MSDLVVALGLVLAIEGTFYALSPGTLKELMRQMQDVPEQTLRTGGIIAIAAGLLIVWLVRG
ncbi:hypothetical protein GGD81_004463 [Rhodobium orientis]|uniref:DUF2065 domain-containing protein n=1 Tax=Rhodobium orientis TaxID=34017 RepID=A0A327JJ48_9HYPH|nr:DUF2065 domain-containing protein [Rhodobium orientis]MBB4305387.1 hypothetical protein [Rhodobium orientis]MBK5950079.1 hypothetical protein [Rhodobium orientis]RAI25253.1 hypothetical protein CH339_19095 [Rhodobium orientis]